MIDTATDDTLLRLGTRGSLLARAQSELVAESLRRAHPGLRVSLVVFKTSGDRITDQPLHEFGGKGLFTKELEQALLAGRIDFAVHSFKDVPVTMPLVDQTDLLIAAVPKREEPWDVLASFKARRLYDLPAWSRVGTGSLRRRCQVQLARPRLVVEPIRGNIDTRLRKLRDGEYDAIVLALAGVKRAGLFDASFMTTIPIHTMVPAPGQGALALQCRKADGRTRYLLAALNHPATATCVGAERALVAALEGDCHSPIGALAVLAGRLTLYAAVGSRDGNPPVLTATGHSDLSTPKAAVDQAFRALSKRNVQGRLRGEL